MHTQVAARIFHDWLVTEGLLPEALAAVTSTPAEMANIAPITDTGKQYLRSKQPQTIGFNESKRDIVVFLKRAAPVSKKALTTLPSAVDDVAIHYRQGVQEQVGQLPAAPFGGPAYTTRHVGGTDRYTCGSSIGPGNFRDAGTLGALVRNGAGQLFGLTNNHVSGGCNFAGIGLPVVAPGIHDVVPLGLPPFTLGFHHQSLPMVVGSPDNVNPALNTDVSLFRIDNEDLVSSGQRGDYDTPVATMPLVAGLNVEKVGRTTGRTSGVVVSQVFASFAVPFTAPLYGFNGTIYFDPVFTISGIADMFSDNGDSGSLITAIDPADGQRKAVALLFAGMSDGKAPGQKLTVALAIEPILAALGVTLVAGHNV